MFASDPAASDRRPPSSGPLTSSRAVAPDAVDASTVVPSQSHSYDSRAEAAGPARATMNEATSTDAAARDTNTNPPQRTLNCADTGAPVQVAQPPLVGAHKRVNTGQLVRIGRENGMNRTPLARRCEECHSMWVHESGTPDPTHRRRQALTSHKGVSRDHTHSPRGRRHHRSHEPCAGGMRSTGLVHSGP